MSVKRNDTHVTTACIFSHEWLLHLSGLWCQCVGTETTLSWPNVHLFHVCVCQEL